MRTIPRILLTLLVACAILSGCSGHESYPPRRIGRLDRELRLGAIPADSNMREGARALFVVSGYGELTDSAVSVYASMPSITLHEAVVDSVFPTLDAEEQAVGSLLGRASGMLPRVSVAGIYAIVSPFNQSVFTVDSLLYIGLNHYLGTEYEPYGYFPDYIRRRKTRDRIADDVAETLVRGTYPPVGADRTVSRLLYEGAVAEAMMRLTGHDEAQVLGYTPEEMRWLEDNEGEMWKALVERRMIFSGNPSDVRALVAPGAVTPSLHPEAPGAAGRFIGHRIVRAYLDSHRDTPLETLLTPEFYNSDQTLRDSRYNP